MLVLLHCRNRVSKDNKQFVDIDRKLAFQREGFKGKVVAVQAITRQSRWGTTELRRLLPAPPRWRTLARTVHRLSRKSSVAGGEVVIALRSKKIFLSLFLLGFLLFSFFRDFHRNRRGLSRRLLFGPLLVLLLVLLVLPACFNVLGLLGFAREIHAQFVN